MEKEIELTVKEDLKKDKEVVLSAVKNDGRTLKYAYKDLKKDKIEGGYSFIIDSNILTISKFVNYLSKNYSIDDIDIDNENIDDMILKLYDEYQI